MGDHTDAAEQPFVRPARLADAADFTAVQRSSWAEAARVHELPAPPDARDMERAWERAITVPPSPRHHTWVAVDRSFDGEIVRGAAAVTPASDPDLDADRCAELIVLVVDPAARRRGHGSRLLVAAMDTVVTDGADEAVVWVGSSDDVTRGFLEGAGWAADGAFRTLSADVEASDDDTTPAAGTSDLRQLRLATSLHHIDPATTGQ